LWPFCGVCNIFGEDLQMRVRTQVVGEAIRAITVGLVLTGGASALAEEKKPFDIIRASKIQGVIISSQTSFKLETTKSSLVGFGMSSRAGEEVLQKFGVPDPAVRLRERFLAGLGKDHAADVRLAPDPRDDDGADALKKAFVEGFVLDFRTRIWRLMYSTGKKQHRFEYWGRVRLVRLDDPKVLWNETCKFMGNAPIAEGAEEDMLANDAALLKATMNMAVDHCVTELSAKFGVR
jgi:hypothetical protein